MMSTLNQLLITVIITSFLFLLLAILIENLGGLFLSRNPFDTESYVSSKENEFEREIGINFVMIVYRLYSIIIPVCFILMNSFVFKVIGIMLVIYSTYRIFKSK